MENDDQGKKKYKIFRNDNDIKQFTNNINLIAQSSLVFLSHNMTVLAQTQYDHRKAKVILDIVADTIPNRLIAPILAKSIHNISVDQDKVKIHLTKEASIDEKDIMILTDILSNSIKQYTEALPSALQMRDSHVRLSNKHSSVFERATNGKYGNKTNTR